MGRLKVVPSSQEEKEAYDAAMSAITFEDKPVELKCRIKCIGGVHKGAMGSVYKITACYYKFKDDDGNNKMVSKKYGRRIKASVVSSAANKKRRVHLIVDDEKQGRSSVYRPHTTHVDNIGGWCLRRHLIYYLVKELNYGKTFYL